MLNGAVNEADIVPVDVPKAATADAPSPTGGAAGASRYRYTRFDIYDMSLSVDSPLKGAPRVEKPEKDLSLGDLAAKIAEYRNDPHSRAPFEIERHKRYALPLAALVFGLVAFPLAIRSHRGGRSIALVGSLAILVTYYLMMTSLEGAALRVRIPAGVAIWAANVVFGVVGLGLLIARLDAHHRSVSRARVRRVHGDRPGRRVGALRRDRSGEDPGQVSPGEAAADVHPRALCLPAPGGAARRAAGRHARSDDLSLFDLEPLPRADRAQGGGREPVSGQRAGTRRGAAGGGRRGALPGAGPAGAQRAR